MWWRPVGVGLVTQHQANVSFFSSQFWLHYLISPKTYTVTTITTTHLCYATKQGILINTAAVSVGYTVADSLRSDSVGQGERNRGGLDSQPVLSVWHMPRWSAGHPQLCEKCPHIQVRHFASLDQFFWINKSKYIPAWFLLHFLYTGNKNTQLQLHTARE